jgi:acid phosphatase type 7
MIGARRAIVVALVLVAVLGVGTALVAGRDRGAPAHGGFAFVGSAGGDAATVWAVGDGADGGAGGRAVAARIAAGPVDRLLYLGDVYDHGTAADFRDNYATTFGRLAAKTAPTPGNHDWPNHASGYDPYWRRALGKRPAAWYAFRAGGWELLSLDSEAPHGKGSPQYRWLRRRLRAAGTCRLAFWHRPRYSAGTHHGDQADMAPIFDALRGHARIVVAGHEHDMQRFQPIGGITEFVSGAGGHGRYAVRRRDRRLAFADDSHFGALRLRLTPGHAAAAFVAADGRVLDRAGVRCKP